MADNDFPSVEASSVAREANETLGENAGAVADTMPTTTMPTTGWQKGTLVGLVILKRVRFIAVLAGVGVFSRRGRLPDRRGITSQPRRSRA